MNTGRGAAGVTDITDVTPVTEAAEPGARSRPALDGTLAAGPTGPAVTDLPAALAGVSGAVSGWDLSTGVDGPGTRFVVFTAGCPLRCLYCANPETWHMRDGQQTTCAQLAAEAARFVPFIRASGGGATVSGGEPLLQPRFTWSLLRAFKHLGLHTALDTSGCLGADVPADLLADTDLVLLDIKSWDRALYRRLTGGDLHPTLLFARQLADHAVPVHLRFVLVPGLTDDPRNIAGIARFAASLGNVERVDVLPFHKMALAKYAALGIGFPLAGTPTPVAGQVRIAREIFEAKGLAAY